MLWQYQRCRQGTLEEWVVPRSREEDEALASRRAAALERSGKFLREGQKWMIATWPMLVSYNCQFLSVETEIVICQEFRNSIVGLQGTTKYAYTAEESILHSRRANSIIYHFRALAGRSAQSIPHGCAIIIPRKWEKIY